MQKKSNAQRLWPLAGLLALCLLAALPLFAHADPWTALSAAGGLDVRDASNRPVSRESVEQQVRAGSRELLRQAAGRDRMQARLLDFFERTGLLSSTLRTQRSERGQAEHQPAAAPLREPRLQTAGSPGLSPPMPIDEQISSPAIFAGSSLKALFLPLRC
ncbi:MAG: hypothetical protein WCU88_10725 [Elusimicrobiota bacterium]